ncbi:MAG TPA: GNAT family N-acetyltransferase [Gemmatimonadaceae bacterium]|nr:GNAT family N-acetyltransferase [Gemmatimonadaceae bacterium]
MKRRGTLHAPDDSAPNHARIRRARRADAGAIAGSLYDAFVEYESRYTPGGFAATTVTAEEILRRWDEGPVWVAVVNSAIEGTVAAAPRGRSLLVRSMSIVPATRSLGIGVSLLRSVERFARKNGFDQLSLTTTHSCFAQFDCTNDSALRGVDRECSTCSARRCSRW